MVCMLVSQPVEARVTFHDILDAPKEFLDTAERTLWELVDAAGLPRDHVADLAVVGSMAYGIARLESDSEHRVGREAKPSDIDFFIVIRNMMDGPPELLAAVGRLGELKLAYAKLLQERLESQLLVDLLTHPAEQFDREDPNCVWYSLMERKLYHRPGNAPRNLYGQVLDGAYYAFDRDAFMEFDTRVKAGRFQVIRQLEGNQVVWYEKSAWEQGRRTELLRSLPRRVAAEVLR